MSTSTDRAIARELQADGWKLIRNTGHLLWEHPSGARIFTPSSGSDTRRGPLNVRAKARRAIARAIAGTPRWGRSTPAKATR